MLSFHSNFSVPYQVRCERWWVKCFFPKRNVQLTLFELKKGDQICGWMCQFYWFSSWAAKFCWNVCCIMAFLKSWSLKGAGRLRLAPASGDQCRRRRRSGFLFWSSATGFLIHAVERGSGRSLGTRVQPWAFTLVTFLCLTSSDRSGSFAHRLALGHK